MNTEEIHQDHEFQRKKTAYFQNFMFRHVPQAHMYKEYGLLNKEGSKGWRNVARHQVLSGVMTETMLELLGIQNELLINKSLIHDVDKRRQQEHQAKGEVWQDELKKSEKPLVATSTNFTDFPDWSMDEYILRYVDSSVGEKSDQNGAVYLLGSRDPNNLPEVVIMPWKQRIQMLKQNKAEEGKKGIPLYGMTLGRNWVKLWEILRKNCLTR